MNRSCENCRMPMPPAGSDLVGYEALIEFIQTNDILSIEGDIVEIGTFLGGGACKLSRFLEQAGSDKSLFVIDVFEPGFDNTMNTRGSSMSGLYEEWLTAHDGKSQWEIFSEVTKHCHNLNVLKGDSKQIALPSKSICFAFIDGNHDPEYVQSDFNFLWNKLAAGGAIAFHDYQYDLPQTTAAIESVVSTHANDIAITHHDKEKHILFIVKNRPTARQNSESSTNIKFLSASEVWTADGDVRYVPMEGAGKDFCALAHESRYVWVLKNFEVVDKTLLDFGCGSGYGSFMIGQKAKQVWGLDYSPQSIEFAKQRYSSDRVKYFAADATSRSEVFAQLTQGSFDVILSFDVIEHIPRFAEYLDIIAELIRRDGTLIIGCPNRLQTLNWNKGWNPFHSNEFAPEEFRSLLGNFFEEVTLVAQDFHSDEKREQARIRNYGSHTQLPPLRYSEHDLEFRIEPSAEALGQAFGLVAICKGPKEAAARKSVNVPKLRVLLVEPKYSWEEAMPWIPIGKAYLAGVLRDHNFEVRIVDNALKKHSDEELIQAMKDFRPDVVGVGGMTLQFSDTKRVARLARQVFGSSIMLVGGGVHLTLRPEDGVDDFDFIAVGEGENTLLELCERYAEKKQGVGDVGDIAGLAFKSENAELVITKRREFIRDLNVLPLPAYDLLPVRQYNDFMMTGERAVSVMTSRGCPYDCEFCASPELSKRKVRYFSLDYSFRLIEHLKRNYGFTNFRIMDDAFTLSKRRVYAFCDEIKKRSLNLNMSCLTHVEACDREMFVKMKQAGFSIIALGIESGNDRILKLVNKGTTTGDTIKAICHAKDAGLLVEGLFMIGNIGETKETIEDSIAFAKRHNPPFENGKRAGFNWFQFATPFPGSRFFTEAEQYGEVVTRDFDQYSHQVPIFIPKGLDAKTLVQLRDKALRETTADPATTIQPSVNHRAEKEQRKILHVGWGHPPNVAAGPIYYLHQLCLEQKASGNTVECFVAGNSQGDPSKLPSLSRSVHDGITYHIVENRPSHYFDWENPKREIANNEIAALFRDVVERWQPEIVHFHNVVSLSMSLPEVAKECGAATVFSAHNYWTICTRDDLFTPEEKLCNGPEDGSKCAVCVGHPLLKNEYTERIATARDLLNESIDLILAVSTRVKEILESVGIDGTKILIQHIGSRAAERNWESAGRRCTTRSDVSKPVKFAFVGTMLPRKGPHIVLEAVKHLFDKQGEFIVEFYGGGLGGGYEQRIHELFSSDPRFAHCVSFKGGYFHNQLAELLQNVDVAIIPPIWEDNGPQTVMESLAAGVPVIGSDVGGIPDFVHDGKNGLLFKAGDPSSLADAMRRLIDSPMIIRELRKNIAAPLSMSQHVAELEDVAIAYLKTPIEQRRAVRDMNQLKHLKQQHIELLEKYNRIILQQTVRPGQQQLSVAPIVEEVKRLVNADKLNEAIAHLEQGFGQFKEAARLHFCMYELLNAKGDRNEAERELNLAMRYDPSFAEIHNEFGVQAFQRGEDGRCIVERKNLADVYVQQGKADEAIKQLKKVLEVAPNDFEALSSLGSLSLDAQSFEEAFLFFSKALKMNQDDHSVKEIVQQLQAKGFGSPETLAKCEQSSDAGATVSGGTLLCDDESADDAIARLEEVVRSHPEHTIAHNDLGVLYHSKGNVERAHSHFQRAVECDGNHLAAKKNLGNVLVQVGDGASALRMFQGILGQHPNDIDALVSVGGLLRLAKRYSSAAYHLKRALELDPANNDAQTILGLLQQDTPEVDQNTPPRPIPKEVIPPPAPETTPSAKTGYQRKLDAEITTYEDNVNVHNLPEIFHVVNNTSLLPWLQELTGQPDHTKWWVKEIDELVSKHDRIVNILSIGCGNGDIEIDLVSRLNEPERVRLTGLDVNPTMIARANAMARERGVANTVFEVHDLNNLQLRETFDVIIASHSLHHIVQLETLFAAIDANASEDMIFLVNDMFGQNGHVMWPNTSSVVNRVWNTLDKKYKYNAYWKGYDVHPMNHDCSSSGFEGIRAQDILPLMVERFDVEVFLPFSTIINRFSDRAYGHNFKPENKADVDLMMRILALDVQMLKEKKLSPVQAFIKLRKKGRVQKMRYLFQTPEDVLRLRTTELKETDFYWDAESGSQAVDTMLLKEESDEEAIVRLEKLLHQEPEHAVAHNDLGVLYFRKGDVQRAVLYFQRAVDLNDNNVSAKKNLADAFIHLGEGKKAQRMYQGIVGQCPEDVEALLTLGELMRQEERYSSSAYYFRQALEIEPNNADVKNAFARLPEHVVKEYAMPTGNETSYEQTNEATGVMENPDGDCVDEVMTVGGQQLTILCKPRHTRRDELVELYWHRHPRFTFLKNAPRNANFLDLGAGSGGLVTWREWLSPKREDIQMYAVDMVKGEFFNRYVDFQLCNLDYDVLKFEDGFFDAILSAHLFEHVRDESRLLAELRRVSKRGARIYIEVPTRESQSLPSRQLFVDAGINMSTLNFFDDATHLRTFSLETLSLLVSQSGFKVLASGIIDNKYIEDEMLTYGVTHNDAEVNTYAMWSKTHFAHHIISEAV